MHTNSQRKFPSAKEPDERQSSLPFIPTIIQSGNESPTRYVKIALYSSIFNYSEILSPIPHTLFLLQSQSHVDTLQAYRLDHSLLALR